MICRATQRQSELSAKISNDTVSKITTSIHINKGEKLIKEKSQKTHKLDFKKSTEIEIMNCRATQKFELYKENPTKTKNQQNPNTSIRKRLIK